MRHPNLGKADGFTLIDMLFVVGLIGVLSVIALPRMLLARQSADAASAIGSMRAVNSAQLTFALTCGGGFYAPDLVTLGTPPPTSAQAFIAPSLTGANTVTHSGYLIKMQASAFPGAPGSCNGLAVGQAGQGFKAAADPVEAGNPRFFATNSNGQIYEDNASLFAAMPQTGEPTAGHVLK